MYVCMYVCMFICYFSIFMLVCMPVELSSLPYVAITAIGRVVRLVQSTPRSRSTSPNERGHSAQFYFIAKCSWNKCACALTVVHTDAVT